MGFLSRIEAAVARVRAGIARVPDDLPAKVVAFFDSPSGGPEYDENGDTAYPPGAQILFDPDRKTRRR